MQIERARRFRFLNSKSTIATRRTRGASYRGSKKILKQLIVFSRTRDGKAGITLPPNYGPDYVKPFTAMFPQLAKEYKVKLLPFLLVHVYQNPGMMQPAWLPSIM